MERVEEKLRASFSCQKSKQLKCTGETCQGSVKERFALYLQRIKIVPQILSTSLLNHVIHYILPSDTGRTRCDVAFPQYEWLECVVAFSAVHTRAAKDLTKCNNN